MREVFLLFRKGMKNKKSSFIGIFLLMLLMSMTLISVVTIRQNYKERQQTAVKQDGYSDAVFWIFDKNLENYQMTSDDLIKSTKNNKAVLNVSSMPFVSANANKIHGKKQQNSLFIQSTKNSIFSYTYFNKDLKTVHKGSVTLKNNEVAVPLSYVSSLHCKIGDTISFGEGDNKITLVIKTFFEDPFMGISVMGVKTFLVNETTFDDFVKLSSNGDNDVLHKGTILNIAQKKLKTSETDLSFIRKLNKENQISSYASFAITKQESTNYMLMLTNIFSGVLVAFFFLLFIITIIIISHSIGNSIEMEFKDIGILKAMGFSTSKLQLTFLLEYGTVMLAGCIVGIIPSIPVILFVNDLTRPVINLAVSKEIAVFPCFLFEVFILLILCLFTFLKLSVLRKIRPLAAIRDGNSAVVFKSRLQLPIHKRFLSLSLAYRSLVTGKKNYIGVIFISAILFFFLTLVNGMAEWGGNDGANIIAMFSNNSSDFSITYQNQSQSQRNQVEETIKKSGQWKSSFYGLTQYLMVDGVQMHVTIINEPKEYNTVYKGRTCTYENEILVTQLVADEFKKGIGDEIEIGKGNQTKKYMISGIYDCANDVGANIAMSLDGFKRLLGNEQYEKFINQAHPMVYEYQIKDSNKTNEMIRLLKNKYKSKQISIESTQVGFNGMAAISGAIKALSVLMYAIAGIFAMITIAMVCDKILKKEKKDAGIFKAIGYTSLNLRLQIAFRMAIASLLGNLLGIGLLLLAGKGCVMFLLRFMGVYHYEMKFQISAIALLSLLIFAYFLLITLLFSSKIKHVSTKLLMSE